MLAVLQEDVGGAEGGGAGAELGQVALTQQLAAQPARRSQLGGAGAGSEAGPRACVCVCGRGQSHLAVLAAGAVGGALGAGKQPAGGGVAAGVLALLANQSAATTTLSIYILTLLL